MSNSPIIRSSSTLPGVSQGQTLRWDTVTAKWEPSSSLVIKDNGAIAANGTIAINDDLTNSISILGVTGLTMNSTSFNPGGDTVTFGGPVVGSSFNVTGVRSTGADEAVANALLRRDTIEAIVDAATYWDPATGGIHYSAGNVGIGTDAPQSSLDVNGTIRIAGSLSNSLSFLGLTAVTVNTPFLQLTQSGAGPNSIIIEQQDVLAANLLRFNTGANNQGYEFKTGASGYVSMNDAGFRINHGTDTRFIINASGNVGIGTTEPIGNLSVHGSASSNGVIDIRSGGAAANNARINFGDLNTQRMGRINYAPATDAMTFETAATERMRITSDGKVGIGTADPQSNLEVIGRAKIGYNGANTPALNIRNYANADHFQMDVASNDNARLRLLDGNATMQIGHVSQAGTGNLNFHTNAAERVRINSAGNVGIGTTNPQSALDVNGTIRIAGSLDNSLSILGLAANTVTTDSYNAAGTLATFGGPVTVSGKVLANNLSWAHCNLSGGVLGSAGVSSVTFQSTGVYYVNFTNAAASTNAQAGVANVVSVFGFIAMCTPLSTTRIQVTITTHAGAYSNQAFMIQRTY